MNINEEYNKLFNPKKFYDINHIQHELDMVRLVDNQNKNHVILSDDVLNYIFVLLDIEALYKICLLNKKYNKMCTNTYFWKMKFNTEGFPFCEDNILPIIFMYCIDFDDHILLPKIIEYYMKWKNAFIISSKFVNYMLDYKTNYIDNFTLGDIDFSEVDFLPIEMQIPSDEYQELSVDLINLIFTYTYIIDNKTVIIDIDITGEKMIEYLAKIFYYYPDAYIKKIDDEDSYYDDDEINYYMKSNEIILTYNELLTQPLYVKHYLPKWI